MRTVIHSGEFLSIAGVLYRAEIWRDTADNAKPTEPQELRFEASEPLVIEWPETSKEVPICASTATLRIESPSDRTYVGLYTIASGAVGLDVYREGSLYWSGTLDPESYEEPYERDSLYPVSLTFSDFGHLDRVGFSGKADRVVLGDLIKRAASVARLHPSITLDDSLANIRTTDGKRVSVALACSAGNFYDEDGKAATYREALETMLQPCGLKLMQRAGRLWLFDLHGLAHNPLSRGDDSHRRVVWSSTSQTLGVDKVANSVTLNFSPYAQSKLISADDFKFSARVDINAALNGTASNAWMYYSTKAAAKAKLGEYRRQRLWDLWDADKIAQEAEFVFATDIHKFRIVPLKGGTEAVGVYVCASTLTRASSSPINYSMRETLAASQAYDLYKTARIYLPPLRPNTDTRMAEGLYGQRITTGNIFLRLKMECLMDMRYNPFGETPDPKNFTDDSEDGATYNTARIGSAWCFAPMRVRLFRNKDDREAAYHYTNQRRAYSYTENPLDNQTALFDFSGSGGGWRQGDDPDEVTWAAYYPDPDDIAEGSALLKGWATNRPCIGRPDWSSASIQANNNGTQKQYAEWLYAGAKGRDVYKWLQRLSGEFIPYPYMGGWLEVSIGGGFVAHDYKGEGDHGDAATQGSDHDFFRQTYWHSRGLFDKMQWLLFKAPEVDIVRGWGDFGNIDVPDVEIRATLHPDAREGLKFGLKCGTLPAGDSEGESVARGIYVHADTGEPIRKLSRAGKTDSPEHLFINSLYSQFAYRRAKIQGEASIDPSGLHHYEEDNTSGKFIATATRQDLMADCGDMTLVSLAGDSYQPITYTDK